MNSDQEVEDEEAVLQEQEVMASPDIEPAEELEEDRGEAETEVEEEDRESVKIEEREDEMKSERNEPARRGRTGKGGRRKGSARNKA